MCFVFRIIGLGKGWFLYGLEVRWGLVVLQVLGGVELGGIFGLGFREVSINQGLWGRFVYFMSKGCWGWLVQLVLWLFVGSCSFVWNWLGRFDLLWVQLGEVFLGLVVLFWFWFERVVWCGFLEFWFMGVVGVRMKCKEVGGL